MSTDHQRRMGFRQQVRNAKSMGEAKAILEVARKNLPEEAYRRVLAVFNRLSFAKEEQQ